MPSHAVVVVNRLSVETASQPREMTACTFAKQTWCSRSKGVAPRPLCSDTKLRNGVCARKEMSNTLRMLFKIEIKMGRIAVWLRYIASELLNESPR